MVRSSLVRKISLPVALLLILVVVIQLAISTSLINQTSSRLQQTVEPAISNAVREKIDTFAVAEQRRIENLFGEQLNNVQGYARQIGFLRTQFRSLYLPPEDVRFILNEYLAGALTNNGEVLGLYAVFLPNALDGADKSNRDEAESGSNEAGRFATYWARNSDGALVQEVMSEENIGDTTAGSNGQPYNSWYSCPLQKKGHCILEPYSDTVDGQPVLMTTVATPIRFGERIVGVIGVDLALSDLQQSAVSFGSQLAGGAGRVMLLSDAGALVTDSQRLLQPGASAISELPEYIDLSRTGASTSEQAYAEVKQVDLAGLTHWKLVVEIPSAFIADQVGSVVSVLNEGRTTQLQSMFIVGVVIVILGTAGIVLVALRIARPVRDVTSALQQIASGEGDLTRRIEVRSADEIGMLANHFNQFVGQLAGMIRTMAQSVTTGLETSEQASGLAHRSSAGVASQQEQIVMVAAASEEMSQSSLEVARNAASAAEASVRAEDASNQGSEVISGATENIDALAGQMQRSLQQVEGLANDSENIAEVMQVIRSVAEQTNLLALNAAIEAARAGEQGRGFAVVADEVRGLAGRTAASVTEIEAVITDLQATVTEVVRSIQQGSSLAGKTAVQVKDANAMFREIGESVKDISGMSVQIAASADQQSSAAEDINSSLQKIRGVADDVAEHAQTSAQLNNELASLGLQQNELIGRFRF